MSETLRSIQSVLLEHAAARAVLERSAVDSADPTLPRFRAAYARAARLLGAQGGERPAPGEPLSHVTRPHWTLLDWTRLALLVNGLLRAFPDQRRTLVFALLEGGEIGEQESLLRTLCLLPEPERYVDVGVAACRTNARPVFEAIACENPFPAAFFPDLSFNQMVLKAMFMQVPVSRIEGLQARTTTELCRMAQDYASERAAAGRSIPPDVGLIHALAPASGARSTFRETSGQK